MTAHSSTSLRQELPSHRHPYYRPHIDGLRALAILAVISIHFGATSIPGGFVGVDVFFVISGFLISQPLFREVIDGSFSLAGFYERRARRILPAFVAVSLGAMVVAYTVFLPSELLAFCRSLAASTVFASNIYSYATTSYFAPSASELPLLHYWSLGVEEQFYFVFPLTMLAVAKWSKDSLRSTIVLLLMISLMAAELWLRTHPTAVFYLLPFRAFELLIGCALALPGVEFPKSRAVAVSAVSIGIAMIVAGMLLITPTVPFPGVIALVPCLGTAAVIWGGEQVSTWPSRLLGSPPFVAVGRLSYSLYLVHWPIVVFGLRLFPRADSHARLAIDISAAILLASMSFVLVERPVRLRLILRSRRSMLSASVAALGTLIGLSAVTLYWDGFPGSLSDQAKRVLAYGRYDSAPWFREGTCFMRPEQGSKDFDQNACLPRRHPNAVIWGDSSIADLYWGLREALDARGIELGQLTASGCAPIVGSHAFERPNCEELTAFAISALLNIRPDAVIMGGLWNGEPSQMALLESTIDTLRHRGIRVIVLGPSPEYNTPVPTILAGRIARGDTNTMSEDDDVLTARYVVDAAMKERLRKAPGVVFLSVLNTVCRDKRCPLSIDGVPQYFDVLHLTREGSLYSGKLLAEAMLKVRALDHSSKGGRS